MSARPVERAAALLPASARRTRQRLAKAFTAHSFPDLPGAVRLVVLPADHSPCHLLPAPPKIEPTTVSSALAKRECVQQSPRRNVMLTARRPCFQSSTETARMAQLTPSLCRGRRTAIRRNGLEKPARNGRSSRRLGGGGRCGSAPTLCAHSLRIQQIDEGFRK